MSIRAVCQPAFARGHITRDSGEMVFMLCNIGLAELIGPERVKELFGRRRLKCGDEFVMEVSCRVTEVVKRKGVGNE